MPNDREPRYGARTRSEMLNVVQLIAFGLSALDALSEANTTEMSPAMRLRYRGCANGLNRSCQQNEKSLAKRLSCDLPVGVETPGEPLDDVPEPQVHAAIQQAQAKIDTDRDCLTGSLRPAAESQQAPASRPHSNKQERDKQVWGSAMMNALADMGMPVQPRSAPYSAIVRG